jgi:hypothetical protein
MPSVSQKSSTISNQYCIRCEKKNSYQLKLASAQDSCEYSSCLQKYPCEVWHIPVYLKAYLGYKP